MKEHAVVIAGGGPTGLMLGAELALQGIDVAIVERRADATLATSRGGGLSARTLEVFDQRGIVDRFLAEGQKAQVTGFATSRIDISDQPTRHNYGLALWQKHSERILAAWVGELPVTFNRSRDVVSFTQTDAHVDLETADGETFRAQYLVGCDGGRSVIRKTAGIEFPGYDATISNLLAEVGDADNPPLGIHHNKFGLHTFGRFEYEIVDGKVIYKDHGPIGVMVTECGTGHTNDPTIEDLRAALIAATGSDFGVRNPISVSRFTDMSRQAAEYRKGRVLLAGDAAHVHYPIGGQGMNMGVQDAMNLGWKLAQVVKGTSPESLLDTYQAERHPVAARMLRLILAQVALHKTDERSKAAAEVVVEMLSNPELKKKFGAEMSQLGIHYNLGEGHSLLGRRMPDMDFDTDSGLTRVYSLLHGAKAALFNFGERGPLDISKWAHQVPLIEAKYNGAWELPGIGAVSAPSAVLVRPDGYVGWVGEGTSAGLDEAMNRWFGPGVMA